MEKKITIAILVLLCILIIIPIIYFIVKHFSKQYKKYCNSNSDCKSDEECQYLKSMSASVCVPKGSQECEVDPKNLISCDLNNDTCGKVCNNFPKFSCLQVKKGTIGIVSKGSNYSTGSTYSTSVLSNQSGNGMKIEVTDTDPSGGLVSVNILESGSGYDLNQILNVIGGDNNGQIKITETQMNSYLNINNSVINLPQTEKGKGYCLPNIADDYKCNPATSFDILVSKGDNKYEWGCYCSYPNYFTHVKNDGLSSCDQISPEICGGDENDDGSKRFYIPETDSTGNIIDCSLNCTNPSAICKQVSDISYCYVPWKSSKMDMDPKYGICMCPSGTAFIDNYENESIAKNCVTNPCYPGKMNGTLSSYSCDCTNTEISGNYISCDDLPKITINISTRTDCNLGGDKCFKDPCGLGKWNSQKSACECTPSPGGQVGSVDANNIVGEMCTNVCDTGICPKESTNCVYTDINSAKLRYRGPVCSPCPQGRCNYDGRKNCDIDFTTVRNCQGFLKN